jgi:hypothetical protein
VTHSPDGRRECHRGVITLRGAFYIELGAAWEADSVATGKLRFGWGGQSVEDVNGGRWRKIEGQLRKEHGITYPGRFPREVEWCETTS